MDSRGVTKSLKSLKNVKPDERKLKKLKTRDELLVTKSQFIYHVCVFLYIHGCIVYLKKLLKRGYIASRWRGETRYVLPKSEPSVISSRLVKEARLGSLVGQTINGVVGITYRGGCYVYDFDQWIDSHGVPSKSIPKIAQI